MSYNRYHTTVFLKRSEVLPSPCTSVGGGFLQLMFRSRIDFKKYLRRSFGLGPLGPHSNVNIAIVLSQGSKNAFCVLGLWGGGGGILVIMNQGGEGSTKWYRS